MWLLKIGSVFSAISSFPTPIYEEEGMSFGLKSILFLLLLIFASAAAQEKVFLNFWSDMTDSPLADTQTNHDSNENIPSTRVYAVLEIAVSSSFSAKAFYFSSQVSKLFRN